MWYSIKLLISGDDLFIWFGKENQIMEELFEGG